MSHEQTGNAWFAGFSGGQTDPERLSALARWCEQLAPTEQRKGFEKILGQHYAPDEGSFSKTETPWYYLMIRRAYLGGKGLDAYFAKG